MRVVKMMVIYQHLFLIVLTLDCAYSQLFTDSKTNPRNLCPQLYQKTFRGYVPKGNLTAGTFTEIEGVNVLKKCVLKCCIKEECNVAFMTDEKCYHISCTSNELCIPTRSLNPETYEHVSMVLVRPVIGEESWDDAMQDEIRDNIDREVLDAFTNPRLKTSFKGLPITDMKEFFDLEDSYGYATSCEVGIPSICSPNEECVQNFPKTRGGTCKCKPGFFRNTEGYCIHPPLNFKDEVAVNAPPDGFTEHIINLGNASTDTKKHLTVTAENKVVRLPTSNVNLTASVSPPPGEDEKYQYEWTSLHQPEGSGAVKHQANEGLQLSKLSEGLYTFKLTVSSPDAYGETFVNVTVLPMNRINQPPKIIITPANQTIKLPNTGAVLDASSSTDDDGIISWHWELQQGPLGYNPQLSDTPTLQLNDLNKPGNYTFKLTVTDTDKATNSSTATISVLKYTDYPPEANAGQDVILYLPHNKITLNGNLSSDDHGIATWEWTKSADDADKAVDMQDTRTPYLRLSDLEEGMYTFVLKVTDTANQSSAAKVRVFVKPPTNQPPVAEAGDNVTVSLPQTWAVLDANKSKDDNEIVGFRWEQVEGPSNAVFTNVNGSVTNVTGLTKGNYAFKVYVTDDNKNVASDVVFVTVTQNKNQQPKANAGGNIEAELPRNAIYLNGSKSSDDWAIVKWKWTRVDDSLAIGNIAEGSDETSVLIVTDVEPGTYIFNLTVFDEQGLSDTDSAFLVVKPDPMLYYLIDITIDCDVRHLTQSQLNTLKGKLALLVTDGTKLNIRSVKSSVPSGKAVLSFYVSAQDGQPQSANEVVHHLREKLRVDASLLGFNVDRLQTAICQNNCSEHGSCDEDTRECICEAFWMQNLFKAYFNPGEDSDCSWSILYVVLGAICVVSAAIAMIWGVVFMCVNWVFKRRSSRKPTTYKLIEDTDDIPAFASRKAELSDSDTDSDVVFESRSKPSRFSNESRNGYKTRNGYTKMGRRVKT